MKPMPKQLFYVQHYTEQTNIEMNKRESEYDAIQNRAKVRQKEWASEEKKNMLIVIININVN